MRKLLKSSFIVLSAVSALLVSGCGGSKEALVIPENMPEICRGIDFVAQPDMREMCGVRSASYQSYKNIPFTRYMNQPKGAELVLKSDRVELRLPNTLPVQLPDMLRDQLEWNQEARLQYIKSDMKYKEFRQENGERMKMFKLQIPLMNQSLMPVCFNVPPKPEINQRRKSVLGNRLEVLECADYDALVEKYKLK